MSDTPRTGLETADGLSPEPKTLIKLCRQLEHELAACQAQIQHVIDSHDDAAYFTELQKAHGQQAVRIAGLESDLKAAQEVERLSTEGARRQMVRAEQAEDKVESLRIKLQSANEQLAHCAREREAAEAYASKWQKLVEDAGKELPDEPVSPGFEPWRGVTLDSVVRYVESLRAFALAQTVRADGLKVELEERNRYAYAWKQSAEGTGKEIVKMRERAEKAEAENKRICDLHHGLMKDANEQREKAEASRDEAMKDARRYRWLRGRISGAEYRRIGLLYGEIIDVDCLIDAAINAGGKHD